MANVSFTLDLIGDHFVCLSAPWVCELGLDPLELQKTSLRVREARLFYEPLILSLLRTKLALSIPLAFI